MKQDQEYMLLRGRIRACFGTQASFAQGMGMSECSLSHKLNGRSEWTAGEIRKACQLLEISCDDIRRYFFYT